MNQHFLVDSQQIKEKSKPLKSQKIAIYAAYHKYGSTHYLTVDRSIQVSPRFSYFICPRPEPPGSEVRPKILIRLWSVVLQSNVCISDFDLYYLIIWR